MNHEWVEEKYTIGDNDSVCYYSLIISNKEYNKNEYSIIICIYVIEKEKYEVVIELQKHGSIDILTEVSCCMVGANLNNIKNRSIKFAKEVLETEIKELNDLLKLF